MMSVFYALNCTDVHENLISSGSYMFHLSFLPISQMGLRVEGWKGGGGGERGKKERSKIVSGHRHIA